MYERMLDKSSVPDSETIQYTLGKESYTALLQLESVLESQYNLVKELRFPFGNNYGWGFKYSHKASHLCYAFFETGAFTVMVQVGDKQVSQMEEVLSSMSSKAKSLWENRYPCGDHGGWIQYRIVSDADVNEAVLFINVKKAPNKK